MQMGWFKWSRWPDKRGKRRQVGSTWPAWNLPSRLVPDEFTLVDFLIFNRFFLRHMSGQDWFIGKRHRNLYLGDLAHCCVIGEMNHDQRTF